MTRLLRQGKGKTGLVLANGGWVTYQHVICLSRSPRSDGLPYPDANPLPKYVTDVFVPKIAEQAEGEATIEVRTSHHDMKGRVANRRTQTYTLEYDRDNKPLRGHVVGRLQTGERFLANHADEHTLKELSSWEKEQVNRKGRVITDKSGRNLFSFGEVSRL